MKRTESDVDGGSAQYVRLRGVPAAYQNALDQQVAAGTLGHKTALAWQARSDYSGKQAPPIHKVATPSFPRIFHELHFLHIHIDDYHQISSTNHIHLTHHTKSHPKIRRNGTQGSPEGTFALMRLRNAQKLTLDRADSHHRRKSTSWQGTRRHQEGGWQEDRRRWR